MSDYEGYDGYVDEDSQGMYDDQGSDMDDQEGGPNNARGTRNKRRSKNDNVGRTFVCGCSKSYLSYPALYTHIKQKHNGEPPEGTNSAQYHTGRGRGRPRKEKPENNVGIVVPEEMADLKASEAKIVSQLSRDLTAEMLENETVMLGRVPFPLKQK